MDDVAPTTRTRVKWNGISYLLVASVAWGINWSLVKFLLSEVPPLSGRAIAGVIGAVVTIGFAAMRGETLSPPPKGFLRLRALYIDGSRCTHPRSTRTPAATRPQLPGQSASTSAMALSGRQRRKSSTATKILVCSRAADRSLSRSEESMNDHSMRGCFNWRLPAVDRCGMEGASTLLRRLPTTRARSSPSSRSVSRLRRSPLRATCKIRPRHSNGKWSRTAKCIVRQLVRPRLLQSLAKEE
jgi:hypothetical protein